MVMALGGVVMTKFAVNYGMDPYAAILCGLAVSTGFGMVNGLLVTRIKLPPFIVTLGTLNIAFAITQIYSEAQTVTNLPSVMTALGDTFNLGSTEVSLGTVTMLVLYGLAWFVLRETAPGRHLYAVGNNPEAARLTGINVDRVLVTVYALAGLFYGIAAMLSAARTGVGDPNAGQTENLDAITGLTLMGVASVYQTLITGILVILAVAADQMSRKGAR
jgi:fructose transport system permease protein